jgi:hypothetical protein
MKMKMKNEHVQKKNQFPAGFVFLEESFIRHPRFVEHPLNRKWKYKNAEKNDV